jgi:hypothetical protein
MAVRESDTCAPQAESPARRLEGEQGRGADKERFIEAALVTSFRTPSR